MKKSNSKDLYKLARRLKAKQNACPTDDSLDIAPPTRKKPSHFRSQSCPFTVPAQLQLRERESNCQASVAGHVKKPSQQWSSSQGSASQTVIIRQVPVRVKKGKELLKRSMGGYKGDSFAKTKVSQQMQTYQLRNALASIQKQSQSTSIKQRILQGLFKPEMEILQHSFQFA